MDTARQALVFQHLFNLPSLSKNNGPVLGGKDTGATGISGRFTEGLFLRRLHLTLPAAKLLAEASSGLTFSILKLFYEDKIPCFKFKTFHVSKKFIVK